MFLLTYSGFGLRADYNDFSTLVYSCFWEGLKSQVSLLCLCTLKLYILDKKFNSLSLLKQKVDYAELEK